MGIHVSNRKILQNLELTHLTLNSWHPNSKIRGKNEKAYANF
jgi:hypothetical protein